MGLLAPQDAARGRTALLEASVGWGRVLAEEDWWIQGEALLHLSRWITPVGEPRRYDTWFFAAQVPMEWTASPAEGEVMEIQWLKPQEALHRNRGGTLPMLFPTVHTLEFLASQEDWVGVSSALSRRPIPRFTPRIVPAEGGVRLFLDESAGRDGS